MKDTVIVFARAPRLGTVKRRLARDIGARAALRFYVATLTRLLWDLAKDRRFRTVVALTPDRAWLPLPPGVRRIPQGRGDLARRMQRACEGFRCGRVVIIGSDIPDATADDVADAFRSLGRADAVFGPAEDGGYWLVGFGPRRPAHPFAQVRWSSSDALEDTLANFAGHRVCRLRILRDVDTVNDLRTPVGSAGGPPNGRRATASMPRDNNGENRPTRREDNPVSQEAGPGSPTTTYYRLACGVRAV